MIHGVLEIPTASAFVFGCDYLQLSFFVVVRIWVGIENRCRCMYGHSMAALYILLRKIAWLDLFDL